MAAVFNFFFKHQIKTQDLKATFEPQIWLLNKIIKSKFLKVLYENLYTAGKDIPIEVRIGFGDLGTSFYLSLSVHDIFCIE